MQKDVSRITTYVGGIKEDVRGVKSDISWMKKEASGVTKDDGDLKRQEDDADTIREATTSIQTEMTYQERKKELRENLVEFYKNKRSTVPLSPLVEEEVTNLAGFYVMPEMDFIKQMSPQRNQEQRIPVRSLRNLLITGSEDQQKIYLTAEAGFGKTSFSKYLAITWGQTVNPDKNHECFKEEELEALANFEFLFLVLLRDSIAVCKIDDIIKQQIIKTLPPSDSKYPIQEVLRREKCLIILDGLDEWTHPVKDCPDQREKIPHRYALDNCVILTTTRPWKLRVSNLKTSDIDKKVELVKLCEDSRSKLMKNAMRKMSGVNDDDELEEKTRDFQQYIVSRGLEHMQTIPILLMYITCLWCNKMPIGDSKVEVYFTIIEFLLSKMAQKRPDVDPSSELSHSDFSELVKKPTCQEYNSQQSNCEKHKHKFCQKFFPLLKALAELAYNTLFSEVRENSLVFDKFVAEKYLKADDMKLSLLSGILTGSTTTTQIERSSKFFFSHKSVQEFLVAIFISSQSEGQKIILEKCKNVQSFLDISMTCEFLSKMNPKMMCEILNGFISVINEDDEMRNYRSRTGVYWYNISSVPLYNIQKMLVSCLQQISGSENIKLCLQDFFIYDDTIHDKHLQRLSKLNKTNMKTLYIDISRGASSSVRKLVESFSLTDLNNLQKLDYNGDGEEIDLNLLLFPSLQTVQLSYAKLTNYKENPFEKLGTLENLQYLDIGYFTISHEMRGLLYNFIPGNETMKEIKLSWLFCSEHDYPDCKGNFDLSIKHSQIKKLDLEQLPALNLTLTSKSLVDVTLSGIILGESSLLLSNDMLNIERVSLSGMEIPAKSFRDFIHVAEKLPQSVTVWMPDCDIKPETEYEQVRKYIKSSQSFVVTHDYDGDDQRKFEFQTRK